jgi:DNA-binding NarL/FixJ family response regulator
MINNTSQLECLLDVDNLGGVFENLTPDMALDVLLLDIHLGSLNSLEYLSTLHRLIPTARIIIYTGHQDPDFVIKAFVGGVHGFLIKGSHPGKLVEIIEDTYHGDVYLDPKIASCILPLLRLNNFSALSKADAHEFSHSLLQLGLVKREIEMADGIVKGKSYKEIAVQNNLSLDTVRHYVKSLYRKLEINNKIQLIQKINSLL